MDRKSVFKICNEKLIDKTTYDTFLRHLNKIKQIRNSLTHGNLQDFYRKLYPQYYMQMFGLDSSNLNYLNDINTPIKNLPNQLILLHMFGVDKKTVQRYLMKDFTDVFVQLGYILDFIFNELHSDESVLIRELKPEAKKRRK